MRTYHIRGYRRADRGFTLIELVVTLAIMGILLVVAVPSFQQFGISNRLSAYGSAMYSTMVLARSEAIKRNSRVVLCKSSDGSTCSGTWEDGWIVFVDTDNNGARGGTEELVHKISALESGYSLSASVNISSYISFDAGGTTKLVSGAFQSGTFTLCPAAPAPSGSGRTIAISATGRPQLDKITTCS